MAQQFRVVSQQEEGLILIEFPLLPQLAETIVHSTSVTKAMGTRIGPIRMPRGVAGQTFRVGAGFDDKHIRRVPVVMHEMLEKLTGLHAETMLITDQSNAAAANLKTSRPIVIPAKLGRKKALPEELFTPIPYIIPAQLFAACLASEKGLNPDQPRTLSKVTRTL